ncbi:unnamed protein product, partial [marine sediment metagenome]
FLFKQIEEMFKLSKYLMYLILIPKIKYFN